MHTCPNCGQACDCIGDDTWNELEAIDCECDCEEEMDMDPYEEGYGYQEGVDFDQ